MRNLFMTHPSSTSCFPNPRYRSCGCGAQLSPVALRTVDRSKYESMALIQTALEQGSVVTHLSTIGTTIVTGR